MAITATNKRHTEAYIWQTIDDEDTAYLVDNLLRLGMRQKAVAAAVRGIARANVMLNVGAIMMPRFVQMVEFYASNGGIVLGGFFR